MPGTRRGRICDLDWEALSANCVPINVNVSCGPTNHVNQMLTFEISKANVQWPVPGMEGAVDLSFPASGVPLQFARTFLGSSITGRFRLGRLGRGWVDAFDISAIADSTTHVVSVQQGAI